MTQVEKPSALGSEAESSTRPTEKAGGGDVVAIHLSIHVSSSNPVKCIFSPITSEKWVRNSEQDQLPLKQRPSIECNKLRSVLLLSCCLK